MVIIILIILYLVSAPAYSETLKTGKSQLGNITDEVAYVAEMAIKSGDNKKRPFIILQKKQARIYVYDRSGCLLSYAPVLLGLAIGDELSPEIARLPLSQIKPSNRITPSGRYLAEIGKDTHGNEVLWVDFNSNLAIHPVINVPHQNRPERLLSETIEDNRISWGCINVPKLFFRKYIVKNFATKKGMVYILPEVKSLNDYIWFEKK
jgi:hypothetical protein